MCKFHITHTTEYIYQEEIGLCHNIARLKPQSFGKQECLKSEIQITPRPDVFREYLDFFGNSIYFFGIEHEHTRLKVIATSEIRINSYNLPIENYSNESWEEVLLRFDILKTELNDIKQYIQPTPMTAYDSEIINYAQRSFKPGRSFFEACFDLMYRIYSDFEFKAGLTTISTPVTETLRLRKGVCQDFAHLAISCIRSMRLPARYMSGYIETFSHNDKEKLVGTDASHAWFAVYIPGNGWVEFDPTNNQIPSLQHIVVGWGRDYADIAPLKGIIHSSKSHKLHVAVQVKRMVE